jgi:hypothetical protein
MMDVHNWADLEMRGFLTIPGFLSQDELALLIRDFDAAPWDVNGNYRIKEVQKQTRDRLRAKICNLASAVSEHTGVKTSLISDAIYFATSRKEHDSSKTVLDEADERQVFDWHQDGESWFMYQNHLHYLHFYIPIRKPVRELSNLSLLPWDQLKSRCPDAYGALLGKGAQILVSRNGHTDIFNADLDDHGQKRVDLDVNEVACTPELDAGDVLLMRGDIVHKTQDAKTNRIAVSFRTLDPSRNVSRSVLVNGSAAKYNIMISNRHLYQCIVDCFDAHCSDVVPCRALVEYLDQHLATVRARRLAVPQFLHALVRGFDGSS